MYGTNKYILERMRLYNKRSQSRSHRRTRPNVRSNTKRNRSRRRIRSRSKQSKRKFAGGGRPPYPLDKLPPELVKMTMDYLGERHVDRIPSLRNLAQTDKANNAYWQNQYSDDGSVTSTLLSRQLTEQNIWADLCRYATGLPEATLIKSIQDVLKLAPRPKLSAISLKTMICVMRANKPALTKLILTSLVLDSVPSNGHSVIVQDFWNIFLQRHNFDDAKLLLDTFGAYHLIDVDMHDIPEDIEIMRFLSKYMSDPVVASNVKKMIMDLASWTNVDHEYVRSLAELDIDLLPFWEKTNEIDSLQLLLSIRPEFLNIETPQGSQGSVNVTKLDRIVLHIMGGRRRFNNMEPSAELLKFAIEAGMTPSAFGVTTVRYFLSNSKSDTQRWLSPWLQKFGHLVLPSPEH